MSPEHLKALLQDGAHRLVCDQLANGRWTVRLLGRCGFIWADEVTEYGSYTAARRAIRRLEDRSFHKIRRVAA